MADATALPPIPSEGLPVYVHDRLVGRLTSDPIEGTSSFFYAPDVAERDIVSLVMPLTGNPEEYCGFYGVPTPFEVSLPEGFLRDVLARRLRKHIDLSDDFALLRLMGRDGVGRVGVGGPVRDRTDSRDSTSQDLLAMARGPHAAQALGEALRTVPLEHIGLSGAMPKMSAAGGLPGERPGTLIHARAIIKFDQGREYAGAAFMEYLCLRACAAAGLPVPEIALSPEGDALTISRFDYAADGTRLGFEDLCALTGLRASGKYQGSIEAIFRILRTYGDPDHVEADALQLLRLVCVNDILRNGDAHLKNFGLLYDHPDRARLAPTYDVLNTTFFLPKDQPALPLDIARRHPTWMTREDLPVLAEVSGFPLETVREVYAACRAAVPQGLMQAMDETSGVPSRHRDAIHRFLHKTIGGPKRGEIEADLSACGPR